ncbi:MAG: hypothetical protein WEA04_03535 [Candidatus Andersenbacteria bacterium]
MKNNRQSRSESDSAQEYSTLIRALFSAGFQRVERDDRLLDVFPGEDREKGVELWERWRPHGVDIVRVRLPYTDTTVQLFIIPRSELEQCLLANTVAQFSDYAPHAQGAAVSSFII